MVLRQIIEQEQLEAKQLEKAYQKRSVLGKTRAHLHHLGTGLYNSGESFLTWMKEVDDVVSIHKRLFRILLAANAAAHADTDSPYQLYQKLLSSLEKKEIVEALGFDPSLITVEKITEIYSLSKLINDDHSTQLILKHFIKDYINAQHSLEWSEIAGGATFEVILTALLALASGGVGAIASLGSKAKKLSQMKKLGILFSELAELLKTIPKPKPSMRKLKVLGDKGEWKKEARKPVTKPEFERSNRREPEDNHLENAPMGAKSVDELIDSDVNLSNSLNGKTGEAFKSNALIDFHLNPDMDVLTKDEYMSLHVYTTDLYDPINKGLRGFSADDKAKWSQVVENADSALAKLVENPNLRYEGDVERGDQFTDEQIEKLFPAGGIHQDMGFKSSSYAPSGGFIGNTTTTITSKTGVKIEDVSVAGFEKEVLFRPGTKFRVLDINQDGGHTYIELEEI